MGKIDPAVKTGWLASEFNRSVIDYCVRNGIAHICPAAENLDMGLVEYAHSKGLFVRAWGVGNIELMKKTVEEGADGTTIDFPDKLKAYLTHE
jgi:glycerophosphoryl diester phosphodiesterase